MIKGINGRKANLRIKAMLESKLMSTEFEGILVSSPLGFSPLGILRMELEKNDSKYLEILDQKCIAFDASDDFIIAGFQLNNHKVLLAPNQNSKYYQSNSPVGHDIWLDFLYASTYFSLVLASKLKIKKLAITHSMHGVNDQFIYCMGDAIGLYTDSYSENTIEEIVFTGCCFTEENLSRLFNLNHEGAYTNHREISNELFQLSGMDCIKINL
jgi:hypothetical protein